MTLTWVLVATLAVVALLAVLAVWQDRRDRHFDAELARIQREVEDAAATVGMVMLPAFRSMGSTVDAMLAVSAELRARGVV